MLPGLRWQYRSQRVVNPALGWLLKKRERTEHT